MATQLTLQLDSSLAERYRCVRDVVAAGVYQRGLKRIAPDLEMAPGNLSSALAGVERHLSTDTMERYVETTGDVTPILYLVARFVGFDPEQLAAARSARIETLLTEVSALLKEVPRAKGPSKR